MRSHAEWFWLRMSRYDGKGNRYVDAARSGLYLPHSSNGNTVLSPAVEGFPPPEGTEIDPELILEADNTVLDAEDICSEAGGQHDILTFHISAIGQGPGNLTVNASCVLT